MSAGAGGGTRTGFDRACEGLGWAAAGVALLYQNPYAELGPEADRFLLLQMLALVGILWLAGARILRFHRLPDVAAPESAALRWSARELLALPLVRWAIAAAGAALVATLLSVDPWRSLLGAPPRLFGLASELALIALFLLLTPGFAAVAWRERWESALLVTLGATTTYALVQWAGLDPLRWQVAWQGRPVGAQGNPLFLAQALVWLAPIAAGRAIARFRAGERSASAAAAALALGALAVALRTGERGPLLGLGVGAVVFTAVALFASPRARARRAGLALTGLLALALAAGSGLVLQRVQERSESGELSGTAGQRLLLWRAVGRLFAASPPSRLVFGFGPESLPIALPPYLPAELPERIWRPDLYHDRAHNAELDALSSGGLLRLGAGVGLALAAAAAVLRLAGARRTKARAASEEAPAAPERWRGAALAAALCGHLVAAQFGVATAATAALFWLTLAALAGAELARALLAGRAADQSLASPEVPASKRAALRMEENRRRDVRALRLFAVAALAVVAFGAWVPQQREGDAMGGRVLLLLLAAAGGIALALVSGGREATSPSGESGIALSGASGARRDGRSKSVLALAWLAAGAALFSLVRVQLPELASGIALKQGRTALEAGRADLAVPLLERARRLAPSFEDPAVALARAEQRLAESQSDPVARAAGFERAAATLARARQRHPGLVELALEEAFLAARRADGAATAEERAAQFAAAVTAYRDVLPRDPQSSAIHRGLGAALLARGELAEAGRELETSVRLAPRSLESRLLLGRQRLSTGDEEGARAAFQAGRDIDPARARRLLEGLVRARPANPEALRDLALYEIVEGRRKEATAALERAMSLTPPQDLPPLVRLVGLAAKLP